MLNDPNGLAKAMNKLYLQTFPEMVRPRTLVTRHLGRIGKFLDDEGTIILKPLQGSGGAGVFIVRNDEDHNLEEIFDAVSRDGYVIAQEYLPAAAEGDTRLFLMNGVAAAAQRQVCRLPPNPHWRRHPQQHPRRRPATARGTDRHDVSTRRNRPAAIGRRRHVPGRPGHRGRQVDGDQRVQSGRFGECAEVRESQLHTRRARSPGTQGPIHEVLPSQLQQRGAGDALGRRASVPLALTFTFKFADDQQLRQARRLSHERRFPMKIGFVVNDVMTEEPGFTTTRLAHEAQQQGHEAYVMGVGDVAYDPDEFIRARARCAPQEKKYKSSETYLADIQGKKGMTQRITIDDLDVLMLRNVPSDDYLKRPWAATAAAEFGRVAMRHGVIVVNDPNGLAKANTKMYFQLFPEEVRPRTLITRDRDEIKAFAKEEGRCVLKPLQGSGGAGVFLVQQGDIPNLNQMIDAVSRDGFVICQEYLPAAEEGDMRLFVMNGRPLQVKGKYAAFRRDSQRRRHAQQHSRRRQAGCGGSRARKT